MKRTAQGVNKHSLKYDTPFHIHGKIRNREKDQEKINREKEHLPNISGNVVEDREGTCIMSAEGPVNSFGANEINTEKSLKANIHY